MDIAKGELQFKVVLETLGGKIFGSRPDEVREKESESCPCLMGRDPGYSMALKLTYTCMLGGQYT